MTKGVTIVSAGTLSARLSEGTMEFPEALRYASLIAKALNGVHEAGRVHGGLSPDVVVLNENDVDLLSGRPDQLSSYAAPEQAKGLPATIASDVFSFGAVFHEILAKSMGVAPGGQAVKWPLAVQAANRLIDGCIATEPRQRFPSMTTVLRDLASIAEAWSPVAEEGNADELPVESKSYGMLRTVMARIDALEREVEFLRRDRERLERESARQSQALKTNTSELAAGIDSVRAYVARTDLLSQRVIEAMEAVRNKLTNNGGLKQ